MHTSLIIATRNRCAALKETLCALAAVQVPEAIGFEIVVVDNGSSDGTRDVVTRAKLSHGTITYIREATPGKAVALNTALRVTRGEILAFLDDDVRPGTDWLAQITAPIASGRYDALSGVVRIAPYLLRPWMTKTHLAWLASTHYLDNENPETAVGANMAIARRVLQRVPRFDDELGPGRLGLWEDTLFSVQLKQAGYRLGLAAKAVVEHHFDPARLSRASFIRHAKDQGRSSAYVAWHWRHDDSGVGSRQRMHYKLRLVAKRLLNARDCRRSEGIATWEMDLVCGIAYANQLRIEKQRPRLYDRFGTCKR